MKKPATGKVTLQFVINNYFQLIKLSFNTDLLLKFTELVKEIFTMWKVTRDQILLLFYSVP